MADTLRPNSLMAKRDCRLVIESYYNQNFPSAFVSSPHSHPTFELIFCDKGKCNFTIYSDSKHSEKVKLNKSDYIFLDGNVIHSITMETECKLFCVEFKALEMLENSLSTRKILSQCSGLDKALLSNGYFALTDYGNIRNNILRIHALMNTNRRLYIDHPFMQTLLFELIINMNESYSSIYLNNPYINKAINYIIHNYTEDITIETISTYVGLNPSYLQKIFRGETGTTVYDYLNQFRVEKSLSLLKNTSMSFVEIAIEVGFNNRQSYFNCFKKNMGISPKLFKKYLSNPIVDFASNDLVSPRPEY